MTIPKNKHLRYILLLLFLSYFFFICGNSILGLSNPDEVFYAQTAKEMARHNSWMTPYLFDAPQFEKPILTYWLLRIGFILFGVSSFSARFFPALFAASGIVAVYFLGIFGFRDEKKAFLSSLILMSCGLYIGLARTVFTDLIFSVFILFSLLSFFWGYSNRQKKSLGILLFFIFSGMAVLTKGPLGLLIPFLTACAFLALKRDIKFIFSKVFFWGILVFSLISLPWYILMFKRYGCVFSHEFFYNDHYRRFIEAEHKINDSWYFYPLAIVGSIFPWSLYLLAALIYFFRDLEARRQPLRLFLACWIGVVFLVFQPAHSKLVSYIFPLFPALSLLVGDFICESASSVRKSRLLVFASVTTLFILILIPLGLIFSRGRYSSYVPSQFFVYALILLSWGFFIASLFFVMKNKLLKNAYLLAFLVPGLLYAVPFLKSSIEPYISSKGLCEYLLKNYTVNNTILCCKPFVRGVRFYTDKDVAVVDLPGKQFFSPHPVPFLDTDEKVAAFLRKQGISYCILKKTYLDDIERLAEKEFKYTVLKIFGNEYLVKVEKP